MLAAYCRYTIGNKYLPLCMYHFTRRLIYFDYHFCGSTTWAVSFCFEKLYYWCWHLFLLLLVTQVLLYRHCYVGWTSSFSGPIIFICRNRWYHVYPLETIFLLHDWFCCCVVIGQTSGLLKWSLLFVLWLYFQILSCLSNTSATKNDCIIFQNTQRIDFMLGNHLPVYGDTVLLQTVPRNFHLKPSRISYYTSTVIRFPFQRNSGSVLLRDKRWIVFRTIFSALKKRNKNCSRCCGISGNPMTIHQRTQIDWPKVDCIWQFQLQWKVKRWRKIANVCTLKLSTNDSVRLWCHSRNLPLVAQTSSPSVTMANGSRPVSGGAQTNQMKDSTGAYLCFYKDGFRFTCTASSSAKNVTIYSTGGTQAFIEKLASWLFRLKPTTYPPF